MMIGMNVKIRRLIIGDEDNALKVVRQVMPVEERNGREPSIPHLRTFLAQESNYLIIAEDGNAPVGSLTAYRMPALCCDATMVYIFEIEVTENYRRQGIGTRMINLLKQFCLEDGVEDIWVATEKDNQAARRLYESTGGICEYPDSCEFVYYLGKKSS